MSHDIRTPMNAIIGFSELLKQHLDDCAKAEDYVEKIRTSSDYLLGIISNVLEMARIESRRCEVDEVITDTAEFNDSVYVVFEHEMAKKNTTFTRRSAIVHSHIWCDRTKVKEVLLNLLSNACKYTLPGGRVDFSVTEYPSDVPGTVVFETVVKDTGIGMSHEFQARLYENFSRERNTTESGEIGTGLGMGIVKHYVEAMKGTITVDGTPGKGTTFVVRLPHRLADDAEVPTAGTKAVTNRSFAGLRDLIAEDNDLNAEIAEELMRSLGFEVERAVNGVECLGKLESARRFDVVMMDIQMPVMDGYRATELIRSLEDPVLRAIPIVAMTANAFEEDKEKAKRAGVTAYLAKPVSAAAIGQTLAFLREPIANA